MLKFYCVWAFKLKGVCSRQQLTGLDTSFQLMPSVLRSLLMLAACEICLIRIAELVLLSCVGRCVWDAVSSNIASNMTVGQSSLISLAHHCYNWHPGRRCGWTCNQLTSKVDGGITGSQFSPSVRPHNPATGFWPPSAEPFSHGTGTLQCLQKEMATYRHWSVFLWQYPDDVPHCGILSPDKTEWRLISATLCGWSRCFEADQLWFVTHIREEEEEAGLMGWLGETSLAST